VSAVGYNLNERYTYALAECLDHMADSVYDDVPGIMETIYNQFKDKIEATKLEAYLIQMEASQ
jgi:hypothetical protein